MRTQGLPPYNPGKPGPSVDLVNAPAYLLANFASVAAFKAAVDAGFTVRFYCSTGGASLQAPIECTNSNWLTRMERR